MKTWFITGISRGLGNRDELQKAMKTQEKNLDREFLGRRITGAIGPWRTP